MPIQSTCECCGQVVLLPDPPPNTKEENIAFRKAWDARVVESPWLPQDR